MEKMCRGKKTLLNWKKKKKKTEISIGFVSGGTDHQQYYCEMP